MSVVYDCGLRPEHLRFACLCLVMMTAMSHSMEMGASWPGTTECLPGHPVRNPPANPSAKINKSCMTEILVVEAYSPPIPLFPPFRTPALELVRITLLGWSCRNGNHRRHKKTRDAQGPSPVGLRDRSGSAHLFDI